MAAEFTCARCGQYSVTRFGERRLASIPSEDRALLSALTRNASEFDTPLKLPDDLERLIASAPQYTPFEKMDRVLEYVARKAPVFGRTVSLVPALTYPIAYAQDEGEFRDLSAALTEKRIWLKRHDRSTTIECSLTLDGWERVDQVRKRTRRSDQAFVAMSFAPSMDVAWDEGFKPALKMDLGYNPVRVDREQHNGKIDDYIISMIRKSGLLVADFTSHRPGVYFETGFALGLPIDVIWTCRANEIKKAHFDTRQYNHVVWKDPADLRKKLRERVEATIVSRPAQPTS